MQYVHRFGKGFIVLSLCLVFILFFQIHSTHASDPITYKTGHATFKNYFQTGSFYLPKTSVKYRYTKYSKPSSGSDKVELRRSSDHKLVGYCYGTTKTSKISGNCASWSVPSSGYYYLKFINRTSGNTIYLTSYALYK